MIENKEYIEQYKILHKQDKNYGSSSVRYLDVIQALFDKLNPVVVMDYGCGRSLLLDKLEKIQVKIKYDPAVNRYSNRMYICEIKPDILICTDVFEHIPEDEVDDFIHMLSEISNNCIVAISYIEGHDLLPNGEPCHCTVKNQLWWIEKIEKHFNYIKLLGGELNRQLFLISKTEILP